MGLPAAGAGMLKSGRAPLAAGVPRAAMRAQELAGLVTPGNALNATCCAEAPYNRKLPLKVIRPAI